MKAIMNHEGIEASEKNVYILRNAGGRAQEALRSIIVSQNLLYTTDVHVVHHLGCGMANRSEESLREILLDRLVSEGGQGSSESPGTVMHQLAQYQFLPIRSDICEHRAADSVHNDIALLRSHPLVKKQGVKIKGWLYLNIDLWPVHHTLKSVDDIARPTYTAPPECCKETCQMDCCYWNCDNCPDNCHADTPAPK